MRSLVADLREFRWLKAHVTPALRTSRLVLAPLDLADASEMVRVLADPDLYTFTGGHPPNLEVLEKRYRAQTAGAPTSGEVWHNWIVRLVDSNVAIGFVQATVNEDSADVAWVIGTSWQGQGFATEAANAMCGWLLVEGPRRITAHIHPHHTASAGVATAVGFQAPSEVDGDGEVVWAYMI